MIAEEFGHQAGDHQIDRQRLDRENQLLDEIPVLHHDERRAPDGFAEGQPGQHSGEEIKGEAGAAGIVSEARLQHQAEHEKIRQHQQQRVEHAQNAPPNEPL